MIRENMTLKLWLNLRFTSRRRRDGSCEQAGEYRNAIVITVTNNFVLDLFPPAEALVNDHLSED